MTLQTIIKLFGLQAQQPGTTAWLIAADYLEEEQDIQPLATAFRQGLWFEKVGGDDVSWGGGYGDGSGYGDGYGYGDGSGHGIGSGSGSGNGDGNGSGRGSNYGNGYGDGTGTGYGWGDGYGNGG